MTYYGEYPAGSGRIFGYPTEGDADGSSYRKDLFEDPKEMEAFKAKYGYDLAVPETYTQLRTSPSSSLVRIRACMAWPSTARKDYSTVTMGVEKRHVSLGRQVVSHGYQVIGVVNSPENVEALQFYKDLYDCCQDPGLSNAFYPGPMMP